MAEEEDDNEVEVEEDEEAGEEEEKEVAAAEEGSTGGDASESVARPVHHSSLNVKRPLQALPQGAVQVPSTRTDSSSNPEYEHAPCPNQCTTERRGAPASIRSLYEARGGRVCGTRVKCPPS